MTKRIILAGVLGAIAMFIWTAIAHMALPWAKPASAKSQMTKQSWPHCKPVPETKRGSTSFLEWVLARTRRTPSAAQR